MMLITLPVSVLSHAEYSLPVMPLFGILLATFPISIFPLVRDWAYDPPYGRCPNDPRSISADDRECKKSCCHCLPDF